MKKLPVGISTLRDMREGGFAYVDKTAHVLALLNASKYYFLSRPRRFGKSLLINTLAEVFSGNEALFRGLHIHPHWNWSVKYPVIQISFGAGVLHSREELEQHISEALQLNKEQLGITDLHSASSKGRFAELIRKAKTQYGQGTVVLIDEYDKPILDNITRPEIAAEMRDGLRNFYSVIKDSDEHVRFAFLTGVSKFSKVSIFSGLNNLKDITLDPAYSTICGYTQTELETVFAEHLQGVDLAELKSWYNGYQWLGEGVYNPFDVLLFLDTGKQFRPYWFETGTPTFLIELFRNQRYHLPDLDNTTASFAALGDFEIGRLRVETLLFQTGYLTIRKEEALFASIANDNYRKNPIAEYEGYYAAVMYAYLCSLGIDTIAEDTSNRGRIDLTLRFKRPSGKKQVYIFEFKVIEGEEGDGSALRQLQDKDYARKYDDGETDIALIGMEFSKAVRNIVGFAWLDHG